MTNKTHIDGKGKYVAQTNAKLAEKVAKDLEAARKSATTPSGEVARNNGGN